MPQTPDEALKNVQSQAKTAVQGVKDAVTLKPQRDSISDAVSNVATKVVNTGKNFVDKAKFYTSPNYNLGDKAPAPKNQPSYKNGTDRVPKTGPAKLHKGEAVLKKEDADKYREAKGKAMSKESAMKSVADELGGHQEAKPKKEIHEIRTRKGKSGGYIHEHHHTHPSHHPMEEHTSANQDAMMSHMMDHMGEANPGEAEADAGQSGVPAAAAQAAPGAPAPGATPPMAA
jgi:hypothetical protein